MFRRCRRTKPGDKPRTMREQMEEHRANPVCASCHKVMDPIGLRAGEFRRRGGVARAGRGCAHRRLGELADGTKVDGVVGLRKAILSRPEVFLGTLTEKLLTYALGRGLDYRDMPAVRRIVSTAANDNYRFSALILGVVHSTPFQMRMTPAKTIETAELK